MMSFWNTTNLFGYRALMLSFGPTRYHPMDELTGTSMADLSSNAVNGVLAASVTYNQVSPIGEGTAMGYNGTTAYSHMVSTGPSPLNPGTSDWAYVFLARWTSTGLGMLAGVYSTITPFFGPIVFVNYDGVGTAVGRLTIRDSINAGYFALSPSTGLNDGQWRHLICQRRILSGVGYLQVYINGVLNTNFTLPGITNLTAAHEFFIGSRQTIQQVAGSLDEFAYFKDRSFSSTEAAAIFAASGL